MDRRDHRLPHNPDPASSLPRRRLLRLPQVPRRRAAAAGGIAAGPAPERRPAPRPRTATTPFGCCCRLPRRRHSLQVGNRVALGGPQGARQRHGGGGQEEYRSRSEDDLVEVVAAERLPSRGHAGTESCDSDDRAPSEDVTEEPPCPRTCAAARRSWRPFCNVPARALRRPPGSPSWMTSCQLVVALVQAVSGQGSPPD